MYIYILSQKSLKTMQLINKIRAWNVMCGSRKYPYHHHGRDQIFQGGGGVNLPNFPVGRGCTRGKYFQRVLMMHKRVKKKQHTNSQFICEDIKHEETHFQVFRH